MLDFLIVGRGIAAMTLAHVFKDRGIGFHIIGTEGLSACSRIAAGIWNPVIFKRMTASWQARPAIQALIDFYSQVERKAGKKFCYERPVYRFVSNDEEAGRWRKAAVNELSEFMDAEIRKGNPEGTTGCRISAGTGVVQKAGYVDTPLFLDLSTELLQ